MSHNSLNIKKDTFFAELDEKARFSYLKSLIIFCIYYKLDLCLFDFAFSPELKSELEAFLANFKLAISLQYESKTEINFLDENIKGDETCPSSSFILLASAYLAYDKSILEAISSKNSSLLDFPSNMDKRLEERLAVADIRLLTKFRLATDLPFFGPGPRDVLEKIDELGRVRQVADELSISYSKLWKILEKIELCLGTDIVIRQQGGAGGGHASLSNKGKLLVDFYNRLDEHFTAEAKEYFAKNFPFEIFFDN